MPNSFLARNKNTLNLWCDSVIITVFGWGNLATFIWSSVSRFGILSCSHIQVYIRRNGWNVRVIHFHLKKLPVTLYITRFILQLLYALSWWRRWRNVNQIWGRTSSPCNFCEAKSWEGGSLRFCSSTVRWWFIPFIRSPIDIICWRMSVSSRAKLTVWSSFSLQLSIRSCVSLVKGDEIFF